MVRNIPTTIRIEVSSWKERRNRSRLTIKLDSIVLDRIPVRACLDALGKLALALRLALAVEEHHHHWRRKDRNDDAKGAKRPAKVGVRVEEVRNLGPAKGRGNGGQLQQAKEHHAVAQRRHVGVDDLDDVLHADVADPVDGICGRKHLDVDARGLHDHADNDEENHDGEALGAAPDVNDLGDGEVANAAEDHGQDVGDAQQAVRLEAGRDVGSEGTLHALEQSVDEADKVQARKR